MIDESQRASRQAVRRTGSRALEAPELRVLLSLLDLRAPLRTRAGDALDWDVVSSTAAGAKILPLLAHRVLTESDVCVDERKRRGLSAQLHETAVHNTRLLAELVRAASVLGAAGVEHVALKGAALMTRYYPHPAMRHAVDLDLLIDPAHFELGLGALRAAGYRNAPYTRARAFDGHSFAHALDAPHLHACAPLEAPSGVVLDLHRRVPTTDYDATGGFAGWLARAEVHELHGAKVHLCSRDDLAAHLCEHFALQGHADPCEAPRLLCDLRVLYETQPPWSQLAEHGSRRRKLAVGLVRALYEACFERTDARDTRTRLLHRVAVGDPATHAVLTPFSRLGGYATRLHSDLTRRPAFALRKLVPTRSYLAERYGVDGRSPQLYARYLTRFFDLTRGASWPPP